MENNSKKDSILNQLKNEEIVINRNQNVQNRNNLIFNNLKNEIIKNRSIKKLISKKLNNFNGQITGLGFIDNNIYLSGLNNNSNHEIRIYDFNLNLINTFSNYLENGKKLPNFNQNYIRKVKTYDNNFFLNVDNEPLLCFNKKMNLEYCIDINYTNDDFSVSDKLVVTNSGKYVNFHRNIKRERDNLELPGSTIFKSIDQSNYVTGLEISKDSKQIILSTNYNIKLLNIHNGNFQIGYSGSKLITEEVLSLKLGKKFNDFGFINKDLIVSEKNNIKVYDINLKQLDSYGEDNDIYKLKIKDNYILSVTRNDLTLFQYS